MLVVMSVLEYAPLRNMAYQVLIYDINQGPTDVDQK